MFLNKLLLKDFGKFNNKELNLKAGVNLVYDENGTGKATVKDFIIGMFYGIEKSKGLTSRFNENKANEPLDQSGYSGKAYLNDKENVYLLERSFSRYNRRLSAMDIKNGRDIKLSSKNSLKGTLMEMDKSAYVSTLCIGEYGNESPKMLADGLSEYLSNLETTGSVDIDKQTVVKRLKAKRSEYDIRPYEAKLSRLEQKLDTYKSVDSNIEDVREKIREVEQEFAMETAKRKREARKLIETDKGTKYEDDDELIESFDQLEESSTFLDADFHEKEKEKRPLTERLWFILLTGLFVVGVIAAMAYILPFGAAVRQIFIVCTVLFVAVTIVEGLYERGDFEGDVMTPSEEDFKQVIYELERKTEAYQDVEIDMSFAKEFIDKKAVLRDRENELLEKRKEREELEAKYDIYKGELNAVEKEIHAINLAINTIMDVSNEIKAEIGELINDNASDIVARLTNGNYKAVRIDEKNRVKVWDGSAYQLMESLNEEAAKQIYMAVRLSVARTLCNEKLPVIIDDVFEEYDEKKLSNILACLKSIDTEQIIMFTSNSNISRMLDNMAEEYNYVTI